MAKQKRRPLFSPPEPKRKFLKGDAMSAYLRWMARQAPPGEAECEAWAKDVEAYVVSIVQPNVVEVETPISAKPKGGVQGRFCALDLGGGRKAYRLTDGAPPEVLDAIEISHQCRLFRHHNQPNGDAVRRMIAYGKIQRLIERIRLRQVFEQAAAIGIRRSKASRGNADVANSAHLELRSRYGPAVSMLMSEGLNYTNATEQVAMQFGVSDRTVRNHTRDLSPRNKN